MSRALVFGAGMLLTGYDAGVAATFCRKLGPNYFEEVIAASGSVFSASLLVADQPDVLERVWRNRIGSGQMLNLGKPLQGKKFLDLDYLIGLCQDPDNCLDLNAIFTSATKLTFVLTNYQTGEPMFVHPTRDDIWELLKGSCSVSVLHGPVKTCKYGMVLDGGYSMQLPVQYALDRGYDEVVVVYNRPTGYSNTFLERISRRLAGLFLAPHIRSLLYTISERRTETEKLFADPRVRLIRPSGPLPCRSMADDNMMRLNALIDLGISDALRFLNGKP